MYASKEESATIWYGKKSKEVLLAMVQNQIGGRHLGQIVLLDSTVPSYGKQRGFLANSQDLAENI